MTDIVYEHGVTLTRWRSCCSLVALQWPARYTHLPTSTGQQSALPHFHPSQSHWRCTTEWLNYGEVHKEPPRACSCRRTFEEKTGKPTELSVQKRQQKCYSFQIHPARVIQSMKISKLRQLAKLTPHAILSDIRFVELI